MSDTLTSTQGMVNLINICIGLGILAKPFALAVSGWFGIISFLFASALISYTGMLLAWSARKILIENHINCKRVMMKYNYNSMNTQIEVKKKEKKSTFQLMSYGALGKYGGIMVLFGFFMIGTVFMMSVCVMIWELIIDILIMLDIDTMNNDLLYLLTFILYLISSMMLNWKRITIISYLGVTSICIIFITIIGILIHCLIIYNMSPPPIEQLIEHNKYIDISSNDIALNARLKMSETERILFAFILFIFGVDGNAALPSIATNLENPSKIPIICISSYLFVSCINILIGSIGYFLYGEYADILLLNNFYIYPGPGIIILIITILIVLNIWASFSMSLTIRCEVIDGLFNLNKSQYGYRRIIKISYAALIFISSYLLKIHLSFIVALASAVNALCGMALSIPIAIYIGAFWEKSTYFSKLFHFLLLIICLFIALLDGYNDFINVF